LTLSNEIKILDYDKLPYSAIFKSKAK
jgi:hypothetical protein